VHREHQPQRIISHVGAFLRICRALPNYFVVYNGPECGASAPDHLHFQACLRVLFPIETDAKSATHFYIPDYGRNVLVLQDDSDARLAARLEVAIMALQDITGRGPEPLLNMTGFYTDTGWTVLVFPRAKHRPSVFHTGELTVSPASIDLSGIVVVPVPEHFEKITGKDIATIFEEVTLPPEMFGELVATVERSRWI
jgi:hypothetical protein